MLWAGPITPITTHNMLWAAMSYERAVPGPRTTVMTDVARGHTELLAAGIFASRAAARE